MRSTISDSEPVTGLAEVIARLSFRAEGTSATAAAIQATATHIRGCIIADRAVRSRQGSSSSTYQEEEHNTELGSLFVTASPHILWVTPVPLRNTTVRNLSALFSAYDRGNLSRRDLFQILGVAAATVPF